MRKKTETTNRELLLRTLFEYEIKAVTAHFDGSGDSGEINQITAVSIDDEKIADGGLDQIVLRGVKPHNAENFSYGPRNRDFDKEPMTLNELVLNVCYDLLEWEHSGWEINAGSFGKIHITVPFGGDEGIENAIDIDYNEYEEDYSDYEEEEYNDE